MKSIKIRKNNVSPNTFENKLADKDRESFQIVREITLKNLKEIEKEIKRPRKIFSKN